MRNFIFKQMSLLVLTFIYATSSEAQTLTASSCTSIVIGNIPLYATDLHYESNIANTASSCTKVTVYPTATILPKYVLEKKVNNVWTTVASSRFNTTFNGLSSGFYRASVQLPTLFNVVGCPDNRLCVIDVQGKQIGFVGFLGNVFTTNEVYIGATQPDDIQFAFVDNNSNFNNTAWDLNETKVINTSGTKPGTYDRYWLAIVELSSPNRYHSVGWTFAQIPTNINIGNIWANAFGSFNQFGSYKVQLAAMTGCNSGWVEATNPQGSTTFFVCPNGSGCKGMGNEEVITLSPNPTNVSFRVSGLDLNADYSLVLHDLSGKTVSTFTNIANQDLDVPDLPVGLYIAQLWNGTKKVQTTKLSIVK